MIMIKSLDVLGGPFPVSRLRQPAVLRRGAGDFGRERPGAERRMRGAPGAEAAGAQYDAHSLWRPCEI